MRYMIVGLFVVVVVGLVALNQLGNISPDELWAMISPILDRLFSALTG